MTSYPLTNECPSSSYVALLRQVDVSGTLRRMAGTTAARGGQAGGLVTVLPDGSTVLLCHCCQYCSV